MVQQCYDILFSMQLKLKLTYMPFYFRVRPCPWITKNHGGSFWVGYYAEYICSEVLSLLIKSWKLNYKTSKMPEGKKDPLEYV